LTRGSGETGQDIRPRSAATVFTLPDLGGEKTRRNPGDTAFAPRDPAIDGGHQVENLPYSPGSQLDPGQPTRTHSMGPEADSAVAVIRAASDHRHLRLFPLRRHQPLQ